MLSKCPECELQVSDKAISCPHCGYPLKPIGKTSASRKNKRRRLPNGFGQISEIKGQNLRNPFRAMVTIGKNKNGRPICKPLKPTSYFASYNDAYAALVEYNKNPYDLSDSITVKELYERWLPEYSKQRGSSAAAAIKNAWLYCSEVYEIVVLNLRPRHIKGCLENGIAVFKGVEHYTTRSIQVSIKTLFNLMLDYAVEYEITDKNYARSFTISSSGIKSDSPPVQEHISYSDEEMEKLWANIDRISYIDMLLYQCYSGWRPQELFLLKIEDVNLDENTVMGGMKTDAGVNRIVPIHPRIRFIVERRYEEAKQLGSEYLFNTPPESGAKYLQFSYRKYYDKFVNIRTKLNLNPEHRCHDGRKHFVTMAKKYQVDEYAIKYIVGHAITDITEKVYTERDVEWLKEEMKKIK